MLSDDDHETWLRDARELLGAARSGARELEPVLRQLCQRAFRDFRFSPSVVIDYLVVSTPGLFEEVGFSEDEVDKLMPLVDRAVREEWAAR